MPREWKAEGNYRPKPEPRGLPERVRASLGSTVSGLWKAAQADAAAELVAERERPEVDRCAALDIMDEVRRRFFGLMKSCMTARNDRMAPGR